jgi:hypothetical protein
MCFATITHGVAVVATKSFLFLMRGAISITFFTTEAGQPDAVIVNISAGLIIEHLGTDNPGPTTTKVLEVVVAGMTDSTPPAPLPGSLPVAADVHLTPLFDPYIIHTLMDRAAHVGSRYVSRAVAAHSALSARLLNDVRQLVDATATAASATVSVANKLSGSAVRRSLATCRMLPLPRFSPQNAACAALGGSARLLVTGGASAAVVLVAGIALVKCLRGLKCRARSPAAPLRLEDLTIVPYNDPMAE